VRKEITSSLSDAKEARPIVLSVTAYARYDHNYAQDIDQGATHYKNPIASNELHSTLTDSRVSGKC
jgi:hypothetical protein